MIFSTYFFVCRIEILVGPTAEKIDQDLFVAQTKRHRWQDFLQVMMSQIIIRENYNHICTELIFYSFIWKSFSQQFSVSCVLY